MIHHYVSLIQTIPLFLWFRFQPTWKALPTHGVIPGVLHRNIGFSLRSARRVRSSFVSLEYELAIWAALLKFIHEHGAHESPGVLWNSRVRYAKDSI